MKTRNKNRNRNVGLWLPPEYAARLDAAAAREGRTRSNMARVMVMSLLDALPEPCADPSANHQGDAV